MDNKNDNRVCDLQQVMKDKYTQTPSYRKVWYAKYKVIEHLYGTNGTAFKKFPHFMTAIMHFNPYTIFDYEGKRTTMDECVIFGKCFGLTRLQLKSTLLTVNHH